MFDKFKVKYAPDGLHILTGAYNSNSHVIHMDGYHNSMVQAVFGNKRGKPCSKPRMYKGKKVPPLPDASPPDLKKKV